MSRSYKKHPICGDSSRGGHRCCNKAIRRLPHDAFPKKGKQPMHAVGMDWVICDYRSRETFNEFCQRKEDQLAYYRLHSGPVTMATLLITANSQVSRYIDWFRTYMRK